MRLTCPAEEFLFQSERARAELRTSVWQAAEDENALPGGLYRKKRPRLERRHRFANLRPKLLSPYPCSLRNGFGETTHDAQHHDRVGWLLTPLKGCQAPAMARHWANAPLASSDFRRRSWSASSIPRRCISNIAATAWPSSGVNTPVGTAVVTAARAAGKLALVSIGGSPSVTGRPFRAGHTRLRRKPWRPSTVPQMPERRLVGDHIRPPPAWSWWPYSKALRRQLALFLRRLLALRC
jgi:hypothetical protein